MLGNLRTHVEADSPVACAPLSCTLVRTTIEYWHAGSSRRHACTPAKKRSVKRFFPVTPAQAGGCARPVIAHALNAARALQACMSILHRCPLMLCRLR